MDVGVAHCASHRVTVVVTGAEHRSRVDQDVTVTVLTVSLYADTVAAVKKEARVTPKKERIVLEGSI